jgi:transposase InsO family protein
MADAGCFGTPSHPSAEWLARQITEAFPWDTTPKYLIRDHDRAFGGAFKARVRAMGIRDRPISFRSSWQNGYVERLIGSIRRECTDHLIVVNAEHLRRILAKYDDQTADIVPLPGNPSSAGIHFP